MMRFPLRRGLAVVLAGAGLTALGPVAIRAQNEGAATGAGALRALRQAIQAREQANKNGVEVHQRVVALSEETDSLYLRYQTAYAHLQSLLKFNQGMRDVIGEQEVQIADLTRQLDQVDEVARSVTPLMHRMIDALERFVTLDIPFLAEERAERVATLRRLMRRADVTVSEKYRNIMEAYQIENEYGRTIEAYRATLPTSGETVDFLRFGRIALVYLALDQSEVGAWDSRARAWKELDSSYVADVRDGLRVARKQVAPDLIALPLPEPVTPGGEG